MSSCWMASTRRRKIKHKPKKKRVLPVGYPKMSLVGDLTPTQRKMLEILESGATQVAIQHGRKIGYSQVQAIVAERFDLSLSCKGVFIDEV